MKTRNMTMKYAPWVWIPMLTALLLRVKVAQALKAFDKTQMNGDKTVCVRSGGSAVADTGARI